MNNALARDAKKYAAAHGKSFTEVVETAVSELLAKAERTAAKRRRVVLPTFGDSRRKLTWEQIQSAVEENQFEDDMASLGLKRAS